MDELYQALIKFGLVALGVLTTILTVVGTYAVQYLSARRDIAIADLKRQAADKAVQAVEERSRSENVDKLTTAIAIADASTPRSVTIAASDIQAGVTRLRASLPNTGMFPSERPGPIGEEGVTRP